MFEEFITSLNSRVKLALLASSYFSVLQISYWLGFDYPFFAFYGLLLTPVVASFFVGYLTREMETAIKMIIACLTIHTGVSFALEIFYSVETAFLFLPTCVSYWTFHIVLATPVSLAGVIFSEYDSHIISMTASSMKKMKQTIERLKNRVRA